MIDPSDCEAFLLAGGRISPADWAYMSEEERTNLTVAGISLFRLQVQLLASAFVRPEETEDALSSVFLTSEERIDRAFAKGARALGLR